MCEMCVSKQLALIDMVTNRLKESEVTKEDVILGLSVLKCLLQQLQIAERQQSELVVAPPSSLSQ